MLARRRGGDGLPLLALRAGAPAGASHIAHSLGTKAHAAGEGSGRGGTAQAGIIFLNGRFVDRIRLLVDMLERRMLNDALGELPRPIVEMESLRPLSVLIAVEIGPGNGGGWEMELLRNMLARPLAEPRLLAGGVVRIVVAVVRRHDEEVVRERKGWFVRGRSRGDWSGLRVLYQGSVV